MTGPAARREVLAGCHAIVLAAGGASRFGGGKLLAPLGGRPLVGRAVGAAFAAPVETVRVVVGAEAERVREAVLAAQTQQPEFVQCHAWQQGLSASLRAGIDALPADARAVAIFLGDMPALSGQLAGEVLRAVLGGAPAAYPVFGKVPGHPVALSRALFERVAQLEGDRGARALIKDHPGVVRLPVDDPGCIADIDTRDDLRVYARA